MTNYSIILKATRRQHEYAERHKNKAISTSKLTRFLSATNDSKYICDLTSFKFVEHIYAHLPVITAKFTRMINRD